MIEISEQNLPKSQFNEKLKPYWNSQLSQLSKRTKEAMWEWRSHGRPRGDHPSNVKYKEAKREYRREKRLAEIEYQRACVKEIEENNELDQRAFWFLVNKSRGQKKSGVCPIKNDDGILLTNEDDIREEWRQYFESLFTPKLTAKYDNTFEEHVHNRLTEFNTESYRRPDVVLKAKVEYEEIEKICTNLKRKKAPGWDLIDAEHIIYGGEQVWKLIGIVCNAINRIEELPTQCKRGVLIPIPKAGSDNTYKDNNRGITISSVFAKIYEKVLMVRWEPWLRQYRVIDDAQGACQPSCSSLHTNWLLREIIAFNQERGSNVYIASLDIRKAFDTVWIKGLLYRLYETGIEGKLWRIICNMYENFECCIQIGGKNSSWFTVKQGVHQGAPLSMILFLIYMNPLIKELKETELCASIGDIQIGSPTFADDMMIVALSNRALQSLVQKADEFSRKWRYEYNVRKSGIMSYGKNTDTREILLGNTPIPRLDTMKHVGTIMTTANDGVMENIESRITKCRRCVFGFQSMGSRRYPINPISLSKVYCSVSLSKLLYGMEVMDISKREMEALEACHWETGKIIQKLPKNTSNATALPSLGWLSIKGMIQKMQLKFIGSILAMPPENLYKKVLIHRYYQHTHSKDHRGPTHKFIETMKEVGTIEKLEEVIQNGLCDNRDKSIWKKEINELIQSHESTRWLMTCPMYSNISIYKGVMIIGKTWVWWQYCRKKPSDTSKCVKLLKLICGCRIHENDKAEMCPLCYENFNDNEKCIHILFECQELSNTRTHGWGECIRMMPQAMQNDVEEMSVKEKTMYIASGMKSEWIQDEWLGIYQKMICFVSKLYDDFSEQMKQQNT